MTDKKQQQQSDAHSETNLRRELLDQFDVEEEFIDLLEEATHKYDEALRSLIDR